MNYSSRYTMEPYSQFDVSDTRIESTAIQQERNTQINPFYEEEPDDRRYGSQCSFSPAGEERDQKDIFSVLSLSDEEGKSIEKIDSSDQDISEPKSIEKIESKGQDISERSEEEYEGSQFTIASKTKRVAKRRHRIIQNSNTNLNKNNFSNIVRFSVKMMMNCLSYEGSQLKRWGISMNLFKSFIQKVIKIDNCKEKSCSRVNLWTYLSSLGPEEQRMKEIFIQMFQKILRKQYLVQALKKGRMPKDKQLNYIRTKNKELLYFSNFLSSTNLL